MILVVFVIATITATQGQEYTVIDTVVNGDTKWQVVEEGLERIEKVLVRIFDKEKVQTDTITYLQPTRTLLISFNNGLEQYKALFQRFDTLMYAKYTTESYQITTGATFDYDYFLNGDTLQVGLIHEWDALNVRITELQNDPDIKYVDAVTEFQRIQEQQAILQRRYNIIKAQ